MGMIRVEIDANIDVLRTMRAERIEDHGGPVSYADVVDDAIRLAIDGDTSMLATIFEV